MRKVAKILGLLMVAMLLLPLIGCEDPASSTIKAGMEAKQRKDEADQNYKMEKSKLEWEKQKYAMEREDKIRKEQQAREDALRKENTTDAQAKDSGIKNDDTQTGAGTDPSKDMGTKN